MMSGFVVEALKTVNTVVRCIHKKCQLMSIHFHFKVPSNEVHFLGKNGCFSGGAMSTDCGSDPG